jgi:molybdenum cofactor cytidylyltransferase
MIASLILAGGESKRMGFPKLTLHYQGKTLLHHTIHKAQQVSSEVIVVVGAYPEHYNPEVEKAGARVIENLYWSEGLASSLRVGVAALSLTVEAVLIVLADQPFVPVTHLQTLETTWQQTNASLVFSRYQGILGAPCLIDKSLFAKVQTLRGDKGARSLIDKTMITAEVDLAEFQDIDTPDDAKQLNVTGER